MARLREVFAFVAVVSVIVPTYLMYGEYLKNIRLVRYFAKRAPSMSSESRPRHFEEGRLRTLTTTSSVSDNDTSTRELGLWNRTGAKELPLPSAPKQRQCTYKVQVLDSGEKLKRVSPILQSVVELFPKGSRSCVIPCGSHSCSIELTIADEKNQFAGMDAVVFHFMKRILPRRKLTEITNPGQVWVYFTWESPRSTAGEGGRLSSLPVHATWTYHRGSNITTPYGFYNPDLPMRNTTLTKAEWLKGKTKLVSWMASNCVGTFWPRMKFVNKLKKYVNVDVYGTCGNLTCRPAYSKKCTVDLMRQYKFYLSLENAECEDYITEKLWQKPLMQGVVPIVYGPRRKIYEELLPPNSFIYVGDYKSIKELAEYLKLLDSKPELYVRYLEWQYKGSIGLPKVMHGSYPASIFCNLIPVIENVKREKLKPKALKHHSISHSCRSKDKSKVKSSAFGLNQWSPW